MTLQPALFSYLIDVQKSNREERKERKGFYF